MQRSVKLVLCSFSQNVLGTFLSRFRFPFRILKGIVNPRKPQSVCVCVCVCVCVFLFVCARPKKYVFSEDCLVLYVLDLQKIYNTENISTFFTTSCQKNLLGSSSSCALINPQPVRILQSVCVSVFCREI